MKLAERRRRLHGPVPRRWPSRRPSRRNTAPSAEQLRRRGVGLHGEMNRRLGRNVLPAANLAQAAEHLLEPGEAGFDLGVLPPAIGLRATARS